MSSTASILPYLFAAVFQLKLFKGDSGSTKLRLLGLVALAYTLWLCFAAGFSNWLSVSLLYLPAVLIYWRACHDNQQQAHFGWLDKGIIAALVLAVLSGFVLN
ncbi:unnamed protein product [Cyprideis torosa]|uniref:Uncharacterized protein n=1 Tax=Cyprideis torosa TaxID=163714 RepID=A0A7R8WH53_9CRUS|nr:unnamed protein product [Cyprideis torosa]CAG0897394.1 unnamed protein product [Cyprideis torosa]